MTRVIFVIITILFWSDNAYACGGIFDIGCNIGRILGRATQDTGHSVEKAAHDAGHAAEKAASDAANAAEKAAHDTGNVIEKAAHDTGALTPVRKYMSAKDIPPDGAGAYGIVVFHSRPTSSSHAKLTMVCKSFIAFFPKSETSTVPVVDQMLTVWPVDDPDNDKAKADDCDFVLNHYDLNASEAAINDARKQNANFDGDGPYLVGWSPSNTRGVPDKLVLIVNMSADNTQAEIDHKFGFWKNKIIENPSLWRSGWSLDGVRVAIKEFADEYGQNMLDAIKMVRGKD